jgi:hypothetical protein
MDYIRRILTYLRARGGWFSTKMLIRVYLPLVLTVLPMVILLGFVHRYGVNVLYWDEWPNVDVYRQLTGAKTNWWQLFRSSDMEDLMFFPKLATFLVERLTYFNMKAVMYCNVLLQTGACALLVLMSAPHLREDEHAFWFLVPLSWLMFSLGQHAGPEGVIWGFRLAWYMITFFCFLALYLLSRSSERSPGQRVSPALCFWLAAGAGFIASFSSLHGLLVWPVGGIYLWLRGQEHSESSWKDWKVSVWAVLSGAVVALYLATLGIHNIGGGLGKTPQDLVRLAVSRPFYALAYYAANIGAVFLNQTSRRAVALGTILLAAAGFAVAHLRRAPNRWAYALPAALMAFGLLFDGLLLGRLTVGIDAAVGDYYSYWTMHITPLVFGLYLYTVQVNRVAALSTSRKVFLNAMWGLFLVLLAANNIYYGILNGRVYRFQRYLSAVTLLDYPHESSTKIKYFLTDTDDLPGFVEKASFLKQNRLNVFHQGQGDIPADVREQSHPPASYVTFENEHADYRQALEQLWDVYLMGDDLQRAFDPATPSFTHDLVLWAAGEAREKNHYLHRFLDKYGTQYIALIPAADGLLIRQSPK